MAVFAGVQRVAALSAGGLDDLFGIIVPGGRDFHLGGIIAAGAGIVFIPANFGAGGRLRVVVHQIVFQRRQLHLGGVITAGAGIVFLPAGLGAGGRFGVVVHQLVFQRRDFHLGGVSAALALAGVIFLPANFGAGGRLGVVVHQVVVVRVRSIPWVYISIRSLAVAVSAVCVVHGRRNAGGCGLKARAIVALNEEMCAHLSFRFVADGAANPVVFGIRIPALIRREGMCAVVLPAAGSACSQGDAGRTAVAGAACSVHRIAAVTLAGADMLTVVAPGLPCAPVVTEFAVLSAALGAGFARGAGRRFGAARVIDDWIAKKYGMFAFTAEWTFVNYIMLIVVVSLESCNLKICLFLTEKTYVADGFRLRFQRHSRQQVQQQRRSQQYGKTLLLHLRRLLKVRVTPHK